MTHHPYLIAYFVLGFIWLKIDRHFGGWINMIAYNVPWLAIVLYFASLVLWPIHTVNSTLEWRSERMWRKDWSQDKLRKFVREKLKLEVHPSIVLPQSVKNIAPGADIEIRKDRLTDMLVESHTRRT